ncbi:MAG: RIP metalloprotease RseP [Betaproteobacteria bacterium]|nr:RIP metalloprotease RseP [Betaproteobacteria bacterium]
MNFLITVAAFAAALGCLIVVHELGHYLVARLCNVKVLRFSVGFGRPLWRGRFGGDRTEWVIAAFPLGGYVKMVDEREGQVAEEDLPRAFNRQSVYRRLAIVVAGPAANFILAIFFYWVLFVHGVPGTKPVLGPVASGTPAASAGFATGELIVKIGDEPVATWQDARWMLLQHAVRKAKTPIEVRNDKGAISRRTLDMSALSASDLDSDFLKVLGFVHYRPALKPVIGSVLNGGAAERAGLKAGDEIAMINNQPVTSWDQMVSMVRSHPDQTLVFEVKRAGVLLPAMAITPVATAENGQTVGKIGAAPLIDRGMMAGLVTEVRYGPLESLGKALHKTWDTSVFSLKMLGKMIVGDVSLKNLSGPITIADYAGQTAQSGWISYLLFLALISISLGVLNLLPIPLLDGGHLMYYMLEIFKGSPVSDRAMEIGQHIGMALLFILMAFALYNDINRLISG